jgi:hypothetical protein
VSEKATSRPQGTRRRDGAASATAKALASLHVKKRAHTIGEARQLAAADVENSLALLF